MREVRLENLCVSQTFSEVMQETGDGHLGVLTVDLEDLGERCRHASDMGRSAICGAQ